VCQVFESGKITRDYVFSFLASADNVGGTARIWPPHADAAARLLLLLSADRAAIDRYLLPAGAQRQTRSSGLRRPGGTDRRTDGRTPDS